jgi:hypothetical protein
MAVNSRLTSSGRQSTEWSGATNRASAPLIDCTLYAAIGLAPNSIT